MELLALKDVVAQISIAHVSRDEKQTLLCHSLKIAYFHQNKGLMQNPPLNLISYFKWKIYFLKLLIRKKILCTLLYDQVKANQIC